VNKIREVPQHPEVIVTHTDAPELYVWNTQTQPNAQRDKVRGTAALACLNAVQADRCSLPLLQCLLYLFMQQP
jgi:histone-binding protein RBBP4